MAITRSFRKEFKRQIRLAIVAAIGFSIAFAWRNAIFDSLQGLVSKFSNLPLGNFTNEIYTAILMTFLGVILILITSKLLKED